MFGRRVGGCWISKYTSSGLSVRFETGSKSWPFVALNNWTLYNTPFVHAVAYTSGVRSFRMREQLVLVSVLFRVRMPSDPPLFIKRSTFIICWVLASSISVVGFK